MQYFNNYRYLCRILYICDDL